VDAIEKIEKELKSRGLSEQILGEG